MGEGAVIVDSASGVTGGGREPSRSFHYPECADSAAPYKVGAHRHTPEISRNFAFMAAGGLPARAGGGLAAGAAPADSAASAGPIPAGPGVIFTPHLVPMNRGILSTIYIPLADSWRLKAGADPSLPPRPPSRELEGQIGKIRELYSEFYRDEPFVRVLPAGVTAGANRVRLSNFCDISVHLDPSGTTLIVVSAIDNMVKGAAGQAVQNMNVIFGFDETAGLNTVPALF
jgi:N-acetyl-gamma-glutamyl-phosphate reductase